MDLNVMIREQARTGLQTQLDAAVIEGDTVKVRKITDDIAKLDVATAPKVVTPPYGDAEIKAAIEKKADWFGVDPRKSAAVIRLGKDMNPTKFANAELFADALLKAVEEEFKPAAAAEAEDDTDPDADTDPDEDDPPAAKPKKTDGPEALERGSAARARKGPWTKLEHAPTAVQADIKRQADKFMPRTATKEQRQGFIDRALASSYNAYQQRKGK